MAKKKKGGLSRFLGAITGSPYERLQKQIEKMVAESSSDKSLAKSIEKMVKLIANQYEGNIDEEEHDLLVEEVEEVDPKEGCFQNLKKMKTLSTVRKCRILRFKIGKTINLDELMTLVATHLLVHTVEMSSMNSDKEWPVNLCLRLETIMCKMTDISECRIVHLLMRIGIKTDEEKLVKKRECDPNAEEQGDDPDHYLTKMMLNGGVMKRELGGTGCQGKKTGKSSLNDS